MIIVIDDDQCIRTSLSMMLRRAGHEVQAVSSPKEAMEVVRREEPGLIMLDMNFSLSTSGDEGLTLLRQIKLFRPDVPVMLMTAWGSIQLAVKGMRAGAFDFVTKPWNNAALMERIETALEAPQSPEGGRPVETGIMLPRLISPWGRPRGASRALLSAPPPPCFRCSTPYAAWHRPTLRCSSRARAARARSSSPRPCTA